MKPNDILAYYGPTSIASVVLLLATTAMGAIWSSAAADFGPTGVSERFEQFGERLWGVVGVESVRYNGKTLGQREKLGKVVDGLRVGRERKLEVVLVDYLGEGLSVLGEGDIKFDELLEMGRKLEESSGKKEIDFYQVDFDHPLWVLFSSGTTGKVSILVILIEPLTFANFRFLIAKTYCSSSWRYVTAKFERTCPSW